MLKRNLVFDDGPQNTKLNMCVENETLHLRCHQMQPAALMVAPNHVVWHFLMMVLTNITVTHLANSNNSLFQLYSNEICKRNV